MLKNLHSSNITCTFAARSLNNNLNNGQASRKVTENMAIFRIVEFNNAGKESNYRDFQSYEECYKAFKKQRKSWMKFAEEAARIQTVIKEHTPFCYSLYQDDEIRLTWEIVVIPENKL